MRKLTKILLVIGLVLSLGGSAAASVAAVTLHNALEEVKCAAVRGGLSLRARIAGLEELLAADTDAAPCGAVPDEASDKAGGAAPDASCAADVRDEDAAPAGVDEVTAPAAHAAAAPDEVFTVRAYNGIIGAFDADGTLFRTVNTAVSTLPAADRAALEAGMTVTGFDALEQLLAIYE